ncbi:hypothetical protein ACIBF7_26150 [Nonomuraea sp. NPDC050478]|uniref:hypothetical protein n=1 Tax=Nonomuraea sp. NPDC050478 TaxID=3364365 RepID=UPI00379E43A8
MHVTGTITEKGVHIGFGSTLLRFLDRWACRRFDERARAAGWRVRSPAPLIRIYSRTVEQALVTCRACRGTGSTGRGPCLDCFGSGESP